MEERLQKHISILFQNMPQDDNTEEIKAEFTQNLIDKYHDLLAEGKDPETAFSLTVASIGNINDLFPNDNIPTQTMVDKQKKRSALLTAGAIMLYILCVLPPIITDMFGSQYYVVGAALMFVMVAVATGMLIYNHMTKYKPAQNENMVNDFKQWQSGRPSKNTVKRQVSCIVWCVIIIAYFVVSFLTGAWYITWLLFIVGVLVNQIVNLCLSLGRKEQ